jgi:long-chain-fatty-acid--CoA ligase ACSBG
MQISTIVFILVLLAIVICIFYYIYYIKSDDTDDKRPIPHELLYEHDKTIVEILRNVATKYQRYPALKYKENKKSHIWSTVNYGDYLKNSEEFAEKVLYNIGSHPRTAILSFNRPEWFYSHMGTMIAGGISVGMYPTASSNNCEYIVNHACVELLVIDDFKQLAKFKNLIIPTVKMILILEDPTTVDSFDDTTYIGGESDERDLVESIKNNNPRLSIMSYASFMCKTIGSDRICASIEFGEIDPEDIATIIYTSGISDDPKGVVISHRNIIESLKWILHSIMTRSNIVLYMQELFISYIPLNHIMAQVMDIYMPMVSVGTVYFADRDALKGSLIDTLTDVRPTVFIGIPRIWDKIYEMIKEKREDPSSFVGKLFINGMIAKEIGLDKAKLCISIDAPISDTIKVFFKELGIELCDVYGVSETSGPISMGVPGSSKGSGIPVMDVKIDKVTNEILVRGSTVFKEYYKNPIATSNAFISKKWFKTGDIGHIDRSGALYVTGRIDDIIITSDGKNISPMQIENMLIMEINKTTKIVEYVVVIGNNNRKFISVILVPTKNYNKIKNKIIESAIKTVNKKAFDNTIIIKKYLILTGETFEIGDCLTPMMKVVRKQINKKYKLKIDKLHEVID